jgi:Tn3 transposase DDE domain
MAKCRGAVSESGSIQGWGCHESARNWINRGHCAAGRKRDNLLTPSDEERVRNHQQCISPLLDHDGEGSLCGTYEATYILDALLENLSALKPRRLHADTHGQSAAVFGPALLDSELMPRIRRWRKLRLCRADPNRRYPSIDRLFSGSVNRALIREHYGMVMPLALAIQSGILAPSAVLARINSFSSRNRFALALQVSLDGIRDDAMRRACINARPRLSGTIASPNTWLLAVRVSCNRTIRLSVSTLA